MKKSDRPTPDSRPFATPEWKKPGMGGRIPEAALEKLAGRIDEMLPKGKMWAIAATGKYIIKKHNGEYRQETFIGGEELRYSHSYGGRNGRIIFVFRPLIPSSYQYVELPSGKLNKVTGFETQLKNALGQSLSDYLESYSEIYVEKARDEEYAVRADVYGGKWGMFQ